MPGECEGVRSTLPPPDVPNPFGCPSKATPLPRLSRLFVKYLRT